MPHSEIFLPGLISTALAWTQIFAWIALGSLFRNKCDPHSAPAVFLLIGSAITSFVYAVCAAFGALPLAILFVGVLLGIGLIFGGRNAWRTLAWTFGPLRKAPRWIFALGTAAFGLYWALAICPPRDADVMRYHLAHIRQIVLEADWRPIPDYHYALPFGWTFNYLPFEQLGLPQGAHLLNLGLWAIALALIFHTLSRYLPRPVPLLITGVLVCFPHLLKMGTTAHADVYLILVVLTVVLLVTRPVNSQLLGFAAWIGMQSRYQAIGIGLAVTVVVLLRRRHLMRGYLLGAVYAAALSSPFYISNLVSFSNPVWPLMVTEVHTYRDLMATVANAAQTGSYRVLPTAVWNLLTEFHTFPVPLMALTLLVISAFRRTRPVSRVVLLLAVMLAIWAVTQPRLYARFSLMLVPIVAIGWAPVLCRYIRRHKTRHVIVASLVLLMCAFIATDAVYSADTMHYLITGDLKEFHEATWFYQVFEWANRSTPANARFLVVVESAQSYYLERPYRRGDPCLSAVVNWPALRTPQRLAELLDAGGYEYLIYHDTDWSSCPGGRQMAYLLKGAVDSGVLALAKQFKIRLVTLRIRNRFLPATVLVLKRNHLSAPFVNVGHSGKVFTGNVASNIRLAP